MRCVLTILHTIPHNFVGFVVGQCLQCVHVIAYALYTLQQIELFSYMGGFIGIWVGISFMDVLDYSTVALNWLIHKLNERRKLRKNAVQEHQPEQLPETKEAWSHS